MYKWHCIKNAAMELRTLVYMESCLHNSENVIPGFGQLLQQFIPYNK